MSNVANKEHDGDRQILHCTFEFSRHTQVGIFIQLKFENKLDIY